MTGLKRYQCQQDTTGGNEAIRGAYEIVAPSAGSLEINKGRRKEVGERNVGRLAFHLGSDQRDVHNPSSISTS